MAKGPLGNSPRDERDNFVGVPPDKISAPEPPSKSRGPRRITSNSFTHSDSFSPGKVSGGTAPKRADRSGHFRRGGFVSR